LSVFYLLPELILGSFSILLLDFDLRIGETELFLTTMADLLLPACFSAKYCSNPSRVCFEFLLSLIFFWALVENELLVPALKES
jgi:hypothetical protein